MKKGIIIYAPEDADKNKRFINICTDVFAESGVVLDLVVLDDKFKWNISEYVKLEEVDFAINRSRNVEISRQLEAIGVRVFNNSGVTEICNDKWKTYLYATKLGIPVMETEQGSATDKEKDFKLGYPRVIKSCGGHGGNQVFLVNDKREEKDAIRKIDAPYIVQKVADAKGRDIRVYVIGGEIVVAMCRSAADGFKSNFSLGGEAEEYFLNDEERILVGKIIEDLKPDYIGIDFMYDGERLVLNEIEDAVGARMVYENTEIPIVEKYANYIMGAANL